MAGEIGRHQGREGDLRVQEIPEGQHGPEPRREVDDAVPADDAVAPKQVLEETAPRGREAEVGERVVGRHRSGRGEPVDRAATQREGESPRRELGPEEGVDGEIGRGDRARHVGFRRGADTFTTMPAIVQGMPSRRHNPV